jgi:hypothetical protein
MKKTIFITYFSFVTLTFACATLSYFYYYTQLQNNVYWNYFPENWQPPTYDIKTGELASGNDTDFYIPWYGIASDEISFFMKCNGFLFFLFVLLLYFPILFFHRKNIKITYWIILTFELTVTLYFNFQFID